MAITSVGGCGSHGNTNNNQSGVTVATTAAVEAGNFILLLCGIDNFITTDAATDNPIASISDPGSGTWQRMGQWTNGQGTVQTGITIDVWVRQPKTSQLNSASNITINYNNSANRDASAVTMWEFTATNTLTTITADTLTGTSTQVVDAGTLTAAAALNPTSGAGERLRVRAIALEGTIGTNITNTASWTLIPSTTSVTGGTAASEAMVAGEFIINTTTNMTSDPIHATSGDWANIYLALKENVPTAPGQVTGLGAVATSATQIDLDWTAPASDGGAPITGYMIERESPTGGGFSTLVADTGTTAITYDDTSCSPETEYNYRVSAINVMGTGTASATDSDTTPAAAAAGTIPSLMMGPPYF